MPITLAVVAEALADAGLTPRGAFPAKPEDGVPDIAAGRPATTVVLAGNAGPAMWAAFSADRDPDSALLDDWSVEVLTPLAERFGAAALFPFRPPYLPFQRWAEKAEACHPSPLGMFIHPDFGLWHGYRGALAFAEKLVLPPPDERLSPCAGCAEKFCLEACPVGAFDGAAYDVAACTRHLAGPEGADCMAQGCRARRACPVGAEARYVPAQAAFHMRAFFKAHGNAG